MLSEIDKFHPLGDKLATAGQPTEAQLRQIREAGFDTVINLALPTSIATAFRSRWCRLA
jgi:hypothetical protein